MLKLTSALNIPYESVLEYYNSFRNKKNCTIERNLMRKAKIGYQEYVDYIISHEELNIFCLIDDEYENLILGFGSINTHPCKTKGNICFEIRECLQGQGYEEQLLGLLYDECSSTGLDNITITCNDYDYPRECAIQTIEGILFTGFCSRSKKDPCGKLIYRAAINSEEI